MCACRWRTRSLVGRAGLRVEANFRPFGSVEATHEFSDRRSARILGERMVSTPLSATEAEKTRSHPCGRHLNAPVCQPASASQRPHHVPQVAAGETLELQVVVLANENVRPLVRSSEANLHLLKRKILRIPGCALNHDLRVDERRRKMRRNEKSGITPQPQRGVALPRTVWRFDGFGTA